MKTPKFWFIVCIVIFLTGIAGSVWMLCRPHSQTVRIVQDGRTLYTIDLAAAGEQTIEVTYQGSNNTIVIQNHHIFVAEADCPDQTCVKMGELRTSAAPIVCLPNRLVIEFTEYDDMDAEVR